MRRFVSIWLARWPIDRLRRKSPSAVPAEPFALTAASGNAVRLSAVNEAAAAMGLYANMMLADARSMVPGLLTAPADLRADARDLARLARWLTRYSPWTNTDGPDGVLLDVTGCTHLFGGEAKLLADMERRLTDFGLTHRAGLADTPGAAHALARYGNTPWAPPGGTAEALKDLPVEGLRLDADTVTLLKRLGLRRIGRLYGLPRAALGRRFRSAERRAALLDRLDRVLGQTGDPFSPLLPVPDYRAGLSLAEPVQELAAVTRIVEHLAADLCGMLKEGGLGTQRLVLDLWRVDGTVARLAAGASRPTHDPRHIERLLAEHLEGLDAGFGIDRAGLGAERVAPLTARQSALCAGEAVDEAALARLIDRLAARFGEDAVTRLEARDSHIPERAGQAVALLSSSDGTPPHPPATPERRGPLPLPLEGERCDPYTAFHSPASGDKETPPVRASLPLHRSRGRGWRDQAQSRADRAGEGAERPHTAHPVESRGPEATMHKANGCAQGRAADSISGSPPRNLPDQLDPGFRRDERLKNSPEDFLPPRPFLLFERPEPVAVMAQIPDGPPLRFRWRRVLREVTHAEGPERIAPEWWRQGSDEDTRDYYRVEDRAGRRYWLYREGLYGDARAEPPKWFVHGVFG